MHESLAWIQSVFSGRRINWATCFLRPLHWEYFLKTKRSFTLKRCNRIKVVIWPYLRHQHNNARPLVEASRDRSLQSCTGGCSCWGNASEWWPTPRRPDGLKMENKATCQGLCVRVCVSVWGSQNSFGWRSSWSIDSEVGWGFFQWAGFDAT